MRVFELVTNILASGTWLVFVGWYHIRSRWWTNHYSRNLMGVGFGIFAVLTLGLFLKSSDNLLWIRATIYIYLSVFGVIRIFLMERVQRQSDKFARLSLSKGE